MAKSGLGPAYQLRVALAQYPSDRDCAEIVAEAKAAAAEIVVFPEMYSNGYARFDLDDDGAAEACWRAGAESIEGDFVGRFRQAARTHRIYVVATFLEKAEPKPFNAALLIAPGGDPDRHRRRQLSGASLRRSFFRRRSFRQDHHYGRRRASPYRRGV